MAIVQQTFFLPVDTGRCLGIWRIPGGGAPLKGVLIHLPAFADEMNKARRMTASAAREFARAGYGVLQLDPLGTGDSAGDFGDATLTRWAGDIVEAVEWVRQRSAAPLGLWALRAGALLVSSIADRLGAVERLILWQPVLSGKQYLTQFLRLRVATDMLDAASAQSNLQGLRDALKRGDAVEIGGYLLSAQMAAELEAATFTVSPGSFRSIDWFEVGAGGAPGMSPAARTKIEALQSIGVVITSTAIGGPGFWQSAEIEECPALISASLAALERGRD